MANPAGSKDSRPGGQNIMRPLQSGSVFGVTGGDGGPADKPNVVGLAKAPQIDPPVVPLTTSNYRSEPPSSSDGVTPKTGNLGLSKSGSAGDPDEPPTVGLTSSGGSKGGGSSVNP